MILYYIGNTFKPRGDDGNVTFDRFPKRLDNFWCVFMF